MLSQKENRSHLRRSASFSGVTRHSRHLRRNMGGQSSFKIHPRVLQRKGNSVNTHPYNVDMKHPSSSEQKSKTVAHRRETVSESENDRLRIIDSNCASKEKDIAHQLRDSFSNEKDSSVFMGPKEQSCFDVILKDSNQTPRKLKCISNQQTTNPFVEGDNKSDDEIISMPCFDDEFLLRVADSTERQTSQTLDVEKEDDQVKKQEHEEPLSSDCAGHINSDIQPEWRRLDAAPPMFDSDNCDGVCILFSHNLKLLFDNYEEDKPQISSDVQSDPDLRDMLCIESPAKEPETLHRSQRKDFRQALTFHEDYTCQLCGSNLEIELLDDVLRIPQHKYNGFNHLLFDLDLDDKDCIVSPASQCGDIQMFCPFCCQYRLVQNYHVK